jgi:drug/metabolite transporter (DMT)-like permease
MAFLRKLTQSLTIPVGLFAAALTLAMMFWPEGNVDRWHRLTQLPLLLVAGCAWGILSVAIARKAGWPPRSGVALAVLVSSAAFLVALFMSPKPPAWSGFSLTLWWFCRKLYSESEWNAVTPAEPLTTLHLNS